MAPKKDEHFPLNVANDAEFNQESLEMYDVSPISPPFSAIENGDSSSDSDDHEAKNLARDVPNSPLQEISPTSNIAVQSKQPALAYGDGLKRSDDDDDDDLEARCGFLGKWTPNFLQPLANMKVFMLLYIFQDIFRSMFFSYWVSSISTVEKRYRLPSKWVGSFSAMGEGGKLVCVLLFAHFGGRGHRPRWMSFACLCVGLAAITLCIPETFVPLPTQADLISYKNSSTGKTSSKRRAVEEMCQIGDGSFTLGAAQQRLNQSQCDSVQHRTAGSNQQTSLNNKIWWAIGFFVVGHTIIDAGSGIPRTIGIPFIYDNVKLSQTPMYYAMVYAGRIIGPLSGYTLGSLLSRIYIDPGNVPEGISQNDPQWIGAWYLGFVGIFAGEMLATFMFLWFPKRVRRPTAAAQTTSLSNNVEEKVTLNVKSAAAEEKPHSNGSGRRSSKTRRYGEKGRQASVIQGKARLRDLPRDLYHLLKNPFILFVVFGRAVDVLGSAGFRHLTPKFLENHFRITASKANIFTGVSTVFAYTASGVIGAFLIKKFNFQPRGIATIALVTQIGVAFGTMFLALFPCDGPLMAGQLAPNRPFEIESSCSSDCRCTDASFTPICDHFSGINYFSPCRAGCTDRISGALAVEQLLQQYQIDAGGKEFTEAYTNCSCLDNPQAVLTRGYCSLKSNANSGSSCDEMFYWYTGAKMVLAFIAGLPSVGGMMLMFRLVEPELKSLAAGLMSFTATLMGFLPGSFLAGSILDATCILWNKAGTTDASGCRSGGGGLSNCLLYDNRSMRLYFHVFVGIIRAFGLIFDAAVLWWVWSIKFHTDDEQEAEARRRRNSRRKSQDSIDRSKTK